MEDLKINVESIYYALTFINASKERLTELSTALDNIDISGVQLRTAGLLSTARTTVKKILNDTLSDINKRLDDTKNVIIENDVEALLLFAYLDGEFNDEFGNFSEEKVNEYIEKKNQELYEEAVKKAEEEHNNKFNNDPSYRYDVILANLLSQNGYESLQQIDDKKEEFMTKIKDLQKRKNEILYSDAQMTLKFLDIIDGTNNYTVTNFNSLSKREILAYRYIDENGLEIYCDSQLAIPNQYIGKAEALTYSDMCGETEFYNKVKSGFEDNLFYARSLPSYLTGNSYIMSGVGTTGSYSKTKDYEDFYNEVTNITINEQSKLEEINTMLSSAEGELSNLASLKQGILDYAHYYTYDEFGYILRDDFDENCKNISDDEIDVAINNIKNKAKFSSTNNDNIPGALSFAYTSTSITLDTREEQMQVIYSLISGNDKFSFGKGSVSYVDENGKQIYLESKDDLFSNYSMWASEMTKEQKQIFYYNWNTGGYEAAYEYLDSISDVLDPTYIVNQTKRDQEFASAHPGTASALSVLMGPIEGLDAIRYSMQQKFNDDKMYRSQLYAAGDTMRSQVSEDIGKSGKFGAKANAFMYNVSMSVADNLFSMVLTGGNPVASGIILGAGGYDNSINDALSRGLTDDQARLYATSMAVVEAATESWSLDKLVNIKWLKNLDGQKTLTQILGKTFDQAKSEGLEELTSSIVGEWVDQLIAGDNSAFNLSINNYMNQGYSYDQALVMAQQDQLKEFGTSFLSGFVSGGMTGGGKITGSYISNVYQNHKNKNMFLDSLGSVVSENIKSKNYDVAIDAIMNQEGKTNAEKALYANTVIAALENFQVIDGDMKQKLNDVIKKHVGSDSVDIIHNTEVIPIQSNINNSNFLNLFNLVKNFDIKTKMIETISDRLFTYKVFEHKKNLVDFESIVSFVNLSNEDLNEIILSVKNSVSKKRAAALALYVKKKNISFDGIDSKNQDDVFNMYMSIYDRLFCDGISIVEKMKICTLLNSISHYNSSSLVVRMAEVDPKFDYRLVISDGISEIKDKNISFDINDFYSMDNIKKGENGAVVVITNNQTVSMLNGEDGVGSHAVSYDKIMDAIYGTPGNSGNLMVDTTIDGYKRFLLSQNFHIRLISESNQQSFMVFLPDKISRKQFQLFKAWADKYGETLKAISENSSENDGIIVFEKGTREIYTHDLQDVVDYAESLIDDSIRLPIDKYIVGSTLDDLLLDNNVDLVNKLSKVTDPRVIETGIKNGTITKGQVRKVLSNLIGDKLGSWVLTDDSAVSLYTNLLTACNGAGISVSDVQGSIDILNQEISYYENERDNLKVEKGGWLFDAYRTHGVVHIMDVLTQSINAYSVFKSVGINDMDLDTIMLSAVMHDTGMQGGQQVYLSVENDKLNIDVHGIQSDGETYRKSHSFNSGGMPLPFFERAVSLNDDLLLDDSSWVEAEDLGIDDDLDGSTDVIISEDIISDKLNYVINNNCYSKLTELLSFDERISLILEYLEQGYNFNENNTSILSYDTYSNPEFRNNLFTIEEIKMIILNNGEYKNIIENMQNMFIEKVNVFSLENKQQLFDTLMSLDISESLKIEFLLNLNYEQWISLIDKIKNLDINILENVLWRSDDNFVLCYLNNVDLLTIDFSHLNNIVNDFLTNEGRDVFYQIYEKKIMDSLLFHDKIIIDDRIIKNYISKFSDENKVRLLNYIKDDYSKQIIFDSLSDDNKIKLYFESDFSLKDNEYLLRVDKSFLEEVLLKNSENNKINIKKDVIQLVNQLKERGITGDLEIARAVYLHLGKMVSYTSEYTDVTNPNFADKINQEYLNNIYRNVICYTWSSLYKELLITAGINPEYIKIIHQANGSHDYVCLNINGLYYIADATYRYNYDWGIDLINIKIGKPTYGFYRSDYGEAIFNGLDTFFEHAFQTRDKSNDIELIDEKIGLFKDDRFEEKVDILQSLLKYDENDLSKDEIAGMLIRVLNSVSMNANDTYGFYLGLCSRNVYTSKFKFETYGTIFNNVNCNYVLLSYLSEDGKVKYFIKEDFGKFKEIQDVDSYIKKMCLYLKHSSGEW